MSFSLIPEYSFQSVCDISPEFLRLRGITLLLVDLDNTLAPYGTLEPSREIADWAESVKAAGIELFMVSNNHGSTRVKAFADRFGIDFIMGANKPFSAGVKKVLKQLGKRAAETALAGDQIFTDVIAANSAGVTSIIVVPIKIINPLLNVRYWLEAPFRAMTPNKAKKKRKV
jgi:HAD superfamily phosphatase (TIGR01668 family)